METNNPFKIPDLTPMYEAVRDYVLCHQGANGFILTDNSECDTMWTIVYDMEYYEAHEYEIKAVRVKNKTLEILFDPSSVTYTEDSVKNFDDDDWHPVMFDDVVYYIPTIFSLAECIQEYVK